MKFALVRKALGLAVAAVLLAAPAAQADTSRSAPCIKPFWCLTEG